jgi:hypothetical protein
MVHWTADVSLPTIKHNLFSSSLYLSHTHTHTHTHLSLSLSLSLSISLTSTHTQSNSKHVTFNDECRWRLSGQIWIIFCKNCTKSANSKCIRFIPKPANSPTTLSCSCTYNKFHAVSLIFLNVFVCFSFPTIFELSVKRVSGALWVFQFSRSISPWQLKTKLRFPRVDILPQFTVKRM